MGNERARNASTGRFSIGARTSVRTLSARFGVLRDVEPGRRDCVRERLRRPLREPELVGDAIQTGAEQIWRRVVGRGDPAVAVMRDQSQTRGRAPAGDPDRGPRALRRPRLEHDPVRRVELALEARAVTLQQGAQHAECLVEAPAPLVEGDADCGVVGRRRARAHADDQAALRQHVDRRERLRDLHRPPDDGQADSGREREAARFFDDRGQCRRAVEPRPAEEEMVVGAEVAVVEPGRNPRVLLEATQRRARSEVDQRQVGAVFHGSPDWRQNCADPNVHDRGAVLRVVGAERQS